MATSDLFVPLDQIAPDAARRMQPGVRFQVSRRTFTEIALERLEAMKRAGTATAAVTHLIAPGDMRALRDTALAQPLDVPGE